MTLQKPLRFGIEERKIFNRSISTVAIREGLLFVADLSGFLYCLDLDTGQEQWVYDTFAAVWGSPFVADGKVT